MRETSTKLQRVHDNKNKTKQNDKNKGITQSTLSCQEKIEEGHLIERVWHIISREPSTTPYSQGFRFFYRHSRRRLGSPWVGLTKRGSKTFHACYSLPQFSEVEPFTHLSSRLHLVEGVERCGENDDVLQNLGAG